MLVFPRFKSLPPLTTETPLVSVVMFCRNRVKFIRRAIESVLTQTYPHWELVIQDGASSDGTLEAIQSYADPRLKIVSEPDSGPFEAMWRAFRRCQGEVIGSCLSDEELVPRTLADGVRYLLCNPEAAAVFGDLAFADAEGNYLDRQNCSEFNPLDYLCFDSTLTLQATLFRRLALDELGLQTRNWKTDCADFELMIRLGEKYRMDYQPGIVGRYTQFHDGQLSTTPSVGFFCALGQLKLINEYFGPETGRHLLRGIPLRKAYTSFTKLYDLRQATELRRRMDQAFAEYQVGAPIETHEKAWQAAQVGKLMLAMEILPKEPLTAENWARASWGLAEVLEQLLLAKEASESWAWQADQGAPGARERYLHTLLHVPGTTPLQILGQQKRWAGQLSTPELPPLPSANRARPSRPLRLAFHASNWETEEIQLHLLPWLPFLDFSRWQLYVYLPFGTRSWPRPPETQVQVLRPGLTDREFVELVHQDEIDLLVELSGIKNGGRWGALATRCAPVQISYLGHPATTGLRQIDYHLVDATLTPDGMERFATEKPLRLPRCFACFPAHPENWSGPGPAPRRLDERFTFASFAPGLLMNRTMIELWASILKRVPGSRLLLANPEFSSTDTRVSIRALFTTHAIDMERLTIVSRSEGTRSPYLYAQADVYLDTFPFSDGPGVAQALAQGVPCLTLSGETEASRLGSAFLVSSGLAESQATSFDQYCALAERLGKEANFHQSIKNQIPQLLRQSNLTNLPLFAATFQQAMESIVDTRQMTL